MKKIHVGIDISKEKCNLCYRSGLEIVREEECSNDVKALKKAFKAALKVLGASFEDVLVCCPRLRRVHWTIYLSSDRSLSGTGHLPLDGRPHPHQELHGPHPW